jgi:MFS family permease
MERRLSRPDAVIGSLTLAALAYSTMQMMVVPALPAIQDALGATPDETAWVISAFLISTAVSTPIAGRLGDLFGKERMLVVVLGVFCLGSAIGAVAPNLTLLIVARALQGVAGAVFPLAYGLSRDVLEPRRVPVAIGFIAGSFGVGGSLGLVLSGVLVDSVSWHATFLVGVVAGAGAIVAVLAVVPADGTRERKRLDLLGGVLLVAGLLPLLIAIADHGSGWTAPRRLGLLLAGLAALALWVVWELRQRVPLVDVRLLARSEVWPVNAVAAVIGFGMYSTGFLVPQLVQSHSAAQGVGFDGSVTTTSLFLLPALLSGLLAGTGSGFLGRRFGSALPFAAGVLLMAAGYVIIAAGLHATLVVGLGVLVTHGIGLNLALGAMANLVVQAAPESRTGEAAGVNATVRTIGGAIGAQIVASVLAASATGAAGSAGPTAAGFTTAFLLCAGVMLAGLALYGVRRLQATSGRSRIA